MNPHIKGYPDPYEYCGSSPSPPNMYSPIFRPMYPFPPYSNRFIEQPSGDDEPLESKMMPYYEQTQRYLGRIQYLEEEINRKKDTIDGLQHQLSKYEQERQAEKKKQSRYWTPDEHHRFLEALSKYGHRDVKSIASHVGTRNPTQVRTHAQKYFLRIDRERQRKLESKESSDKDDRNNDEWLKEDYGDEADSPTLYSNSPGVLTPSNPFSGQNSPNIKRKRETVLITASQAKNAQMYKDAVLASMPSGWTAMDYEYFSRGLISFIDQDDTHTLFKMIKEQFLMHHSIETIELAYKAFHKAVNQKPKESNPNSPGGSNSNGSQNQQQNSQLNNSTSNLPPNSPHSSHSPNLSQPNLSLVLPPNINSNNSANSNNNTPEPTSPTHFSRSPSLGKRRVPPPVNVSRPEYPMGQMPPGPAPSPSSMYGGGITYLGPNGSPTMGMIHPLSHLHPSSPSTPSLWPRPYDMRRLEPPPQSSLMTPPGAPGYFMGPHPNIMMMEHHVPGDDGPSSGNSNGHSSGNWQSPYHLSEAAPNGANWSMNQTMSALSNANLNTSSSSSLGVSTD